MDDGRKTDEEVYAARREERPLKTHSLKEEKNSGEWLYF